MKIGYFADGPWAHVAFERIIEDSTIEICFMTLRYDKRDSVLADYAKKNNIPVIMSSNINSVEYLEQIEKYEVDLFVSMSFNQILKKNMINYPPMKTINCHAGKLPYYRGRNILNWALINDESEFGITVHYVDEGIDTGDIILQRTYPITDNDDYGTLLQRAYVACSEVLYDAIKLLQAGKVQIIRQDSIDKIGLYCGMRQPGDEIIDWNQDSRDIFNFIRAICIPGPMGRSFIGEKEICINKVKLIDGARAYKNIPGQVLGKTEQGFYVKTRDTFIEVIDYQYEGKVHTGDRLCSSIK